MESKLKKWQIVYIERVKYTVVNMIEYKEDTWVWQEYEIKHEAGAIRWLCVEKDENNKTEYSIYDKYYGDINENEISFSSQNTQYELYEKGTATVKDYFGNADVDVGERCEYIDYISEDKSKVLSIEKWEEEIEKSEGRYIDSSKVRITNEIDTQKEKIEKINKKKGRIMSWIIYGIIFLPLIISVFSSLTSGLFVNKSIQKYIDKQKKYTYVTSVTNNTNREKAKIYKSPYGDIDTTVKDIISGVPEGITDTIDTDPNTEEDGIGLKTKNEFAYIYLENGNVYVQVSNKNYANNNTGSTYHNRYHTYYYATYNSNRSSYTYSTYRNSARQQSVNSRTSSGGGTSSGK
ncbi:MAG TPA: DUF4178 domain-containing protein [Clostridiaceae bacterium]|jgi:hypothetical protein|nr:DUF4178 domain-containing protein [Clostridia bacterium]HJJ12699.1 DUF4178 domain-containing protein [Clostridiaceae bacterium]